VTHSITLAGELTRTRLRLAVYALIVVAAAALAYQEFSARTTYGTFWPASGPPPRVDWCDRRYYPGSDPVTLDRARSLASGPLQQVATTPSGMPVLAAPFKDAQKAAYRSNVCAFVVFVKVSDDHFLAYGLSGGP
jgi:hypothetical protein